MFKDFAKFLMCPITKEKLNIVEKKKLLQFLNDRIELPKAELFLINESKSFIYPISPSGHPTLLPEKAIPLEIIQESIPSNLSNSDALSFTTLKKHKLNLERLYKKQNFSSTPFNITAEEYNYIRPAVMKPCIENLRPGSVLDVGGGFGFFRNFTKGRLHLIVDVSEEMLNSDSSMDKANGRSECIPVLDNSFDNVISIGSMEHCQEVQTTMVELARCLKPEGHLIAICWRDDWPACQKYTI